MAQVAVLQANASMSASNVAHVAGRILKLKSERLTVAWIVSIRPIPDTHLVPGAVRGVVPVRHLVGLEVDDADGIQEPTIRLDDLTRVANTSEEVKVVL